MVKCLACKNIPKIEYERVDAQFIKLFLVFTMLHTCTITQRRTEKGAANNTKMEFYMCTLSHSQQLADIFLLVAANGSVCYTHFCSFATFSCILCSYKTLIPFDNHSSKRIFHGAIALCLVRFEREIWSRVRRNKLITFIPKKKKIFSASYALRMWKHRISIINMQWEFLWRFFRANSVWYSQNK